MGRPPKSNSYSSVATGQLAQHTLIFDNGAHGIKAGFSHIDAKPDAERDCYVIPNCIARSQRDKLTYVGSELDDCADFGELAFRRPVEKGFVVNWEGEKAIWAQYKGFANVPRQCEPRATNLILAEALNSPAALQRNADEMVFEEFEFANYYRSSAPTLNAYAPSPFQPGSVQQTGSPLACVLVVDAAHSYTTITPLIQGRAIQSAVRRLEIGGKTMTNHMKSIISMRHLEMQKEDWLAEQIKEECCFVSASFDSDLERTWKGGLMDPRPVDPSIAVDYIMPDYERIKRGFSRPHDVSFDAARARFSIDGPRDDFLTLANERFTVPELLFTPSDIGMQQEGIAGSILQSVRSLPEALQQPFLANIEVVGGTSQIIGFMERLESDLRRSLSEDTILRVARATNPVKNAWLGGASLAANEAAVKRVMVSRQEYFEEGILWVQRKFAGKTGR
ncbi:actin-related protein, ARP6 class [Polychaeton citri CBS 116435]|uniref:Actin-like protein ARP6 n=1 Tax=Polychaeton citri CBS 116435 TaxID=1314669 RepID=A0A9P4UTR7_9PEZI|nr:actin-related protein, ARP6 class [Polychaeton citri CBS 116435]